LVFEFRAKSHLSNFNAMQQLIRISRGRICE
jgi:hypothetical protein